MDLGLELDGTHVLITGGNGMIGQKVVEAFLSAGANVTSIDVSYPPNHEPLRSAYKTELHADISSEESLRKAWEYAAKRFGTVQVCVALGALDFSVLPHESAVDLSFEQFRRTLEVNVLGTFATAREWLRGLRELKAHIERGTARPIPNTSLILIGSESGWWGERSNADYGTSKAAVQVGLLQSLRWDAPRVFPGARVNAVAPGPVNTPKFQQECAENPEQYYLDCQGTTALKKPVEMEQVAKAIVWLASDAWSANVHGQVINVDSGKVGKIVWEKGEC
jgi:NAD(P)-dependent dehydrogenase (short-subunit alcohol dehydrogenase family)